MYVGTGTEQAGRAAQNFHHIHLIAALVLRLLKEDCDLRRARSSALASSSDVNCAAEVPPPCFTASHCIEKHLANGSNIHGHVTLHNRLAGICDTEAYLARLPRLPPSSPPLASLASLLASLPRLPSSPLSRRTTFPRLCSQAGENGCLASVVSADRSGNRGARERERERERRLAHTLETWVSFRLDNKVYDVISGADVISN